jgi:uncharacterized C2H2 Zn-finger protein
LIYTVFRMFSRNAASRAAENTAFLNVKNRVFAYFNRYKTRYRQRKTYKFYRCPACKQQLRLPRGKGTIVIHCPKCNATFQKKT